MSNLEERLHDWAVRYGVPLEYRAEVTSTNLSARERPYPNGTIILAEKQTAGRGQRGNRWLSAPGENLTFSVVLHPDFLPAWRQFYLSKAVCLALTDALERFRNPADTPAEPGQSTERLSTPKKPNEKAIRSPLWIKWPNDIYFGDRKGVGFLIEQDLCGEKIARSIVGIGINVNQTRFPEELPNPTSLALETGRTYDLVEVLGEFYRCLSHRYDQLGRGECAVIDREYRARIYRLGQECRYVDGETGTPFWGTITDVLPGGELEVLHSAEGRKKQYLFKQIEYVL